MNVTEKKKRFPVFYIIYFVFVIAAVVLIHCAMGVVREYLADYESAQPQYEAERVFDAYYASGDYTALLARCDVSLTPFETRESVERYLKEFTTGKKISYSAITTGLDTAIRYIVKADDIKFSSFTLRKTDRTTEKGVQLYEAASFELYCNGTESVRVTAPRGYTVLLNGMPVEDSARTGNEQRDKSCDFMPEGVEGIVMVEYGITGLYYPAASVSVQTPDGRDCPVQLQADGSYFADFIYSDELAEANGSYAIDAAQAIAMYMQNDGKFTAAAAFIDPDSALYTNIRTSETYFVIDHNSYEFEDVRASEFYAYDENTFSCRVTFTHVLKRNWSKDYRDYIDITYFFRRVGDKFLIYDRYNH